MNDIINNLTLVIPAKNEEDSLPVVLEELKRFNLKANIVLQENDLDTIKSTQKFNHKIL